MILNDTLNVRKKEKQALAKESEVAQQQIEIRKAAQEEIVAKVKKKQKKYSSQIKKKQRAERKIDKKIEKIIRDAIAKSNRSSSKKSSRFVMTAEAKLSAKKFEENKGKLPWPVSTGRVTQEFGKQRHATIPGIYTNSSGVKILTSKNSDVKAVFNGVVSEIQMIKGANQSVYIQHGNYFTVYSNLKNLRIKKGDKVITGMPIGKIATNNEGKSVLRFFIFNNSKKQNPAHWIYKM